MRQFTLENNTSRVTRQTVHMDQGVCYCPEFIVTRSLRNYPSRVIQTARAVWKGELPASKLGADMAFASILSGNGERWQNFGEDNSDFLLISILFREMFVNKGFCAERALELKTLIEKNGGHGVAASDKAKKRWHDAAASGAAADAASDTCLLVDDATFAFCSETAYETFGFLKQKGIVVRGEFGPYFDGLEYFAAGLADDGIEALTALVRGLEAKGIRRVITVSGRSQYMLTAFCRLLGIEHELRVTSIMELASEIDCERAYILPGSFYCRYIGANGLIDDLTRAEGERIIANSREFTPLVEGGKRVNLPTMWQAPLCAAFVECGADDELREKILENGLAEASRCGCKSIVAFDPFEYNALKHSRLASKAVFFTTLLK